MKSVTVYILSFGMILLGWMAGLGLAQTPEAKPQAAPAKSKPNPSRL